MKSRGRVEWSRLENAAKKAIQVSGKFLPWQVVTISIDGKILDR